MSRGNPKNAGVGRADPEHRLVLAVVYDKTGAVMAEREFVLGRDVMGHGRSMAMGAVRFVDPVSGELVRKWDPWGLLGVDR